MKHSHLTASTALSLALAFSLAQASPARGSSPRQSPPLPRVASSFGTAPANCPRVDPKLVHMRHNTNPNSTPDIITWVGNGALVGHSGWEFHNHRLLLPFGLTRTKYGYPQKVFWQRSRRAPAKIALYGWNLHSKQRIWFGVPVDNDNPQHLMAWPSGLVRSQFVNNASAPTLTFVPSAGCYAIRATWKGGSWTVPFAAG